MKRNFICLLLSALCNVLYLYADPALPDSVLVHQQDGTDLWVYDCGDEYYNWVESTDGFVIVKNEDGIFEYATLTDSQIQPSGIKVHNRQEKRVTESTYAKSQKVNVQEKIKQRSMDARKSSTGHRTAGMPSSPVVGVRKVLTILMGFSDKPFTYSAINFDSLMNYHNYSGFLPGGSVYDYYYENSYGQLTIQSTIIGPFLASNPSSYYSRPHGSTGGHSADLVIEAINLADSYGIDFSLFDGNNDGYVDCIHVVFAGNRYSVGGNGIIWPYNSAFITPILKDGKNIAEFIMTPELFDNTGTNINSIGTICHELGHVLGSPDFYPIGVSHNVQDSLGTGLWDVMAKGNHYNGGYSPTHHNPYTKTAIFQWTTPNTINASEVSSVYDIPTSSQCSTAIYKIPTSTTGEYYLLENRQKASFDRYLPDSGLLIYHIHGNIENAIATNTVNSNLPQKCYLVDPKSSLAVPSNTDTTSYGSSALNIFPSNHTDGSTNIFFTTQTTPTSQSWAGTSTGVNVCFIQHNGNNMKFVVNPQIEGIETFSDTTAWYHIRNVPAGATITWSLTNVPNNYAGAWEFVIASSSNADSVRVAFRQIPANPGPGISSSDDPDYIRPIYKYADLTVTVSSGSTSYTTTKRIKRKVDSSPFALRSNMENNYLNISIQDSGNDILKNRENSYTYELWHTMYGLMKIQEIQNANEQVSTTGLPQGVYVVLLKENGTTSAQKKIMVK